MSEGERERPRVGVRELRQNLSVYLRDVKAGQSLDVTERGAVVARLGPPPPQAETVLERLERQGRLTRATRRLEDLPLPMRLEPGSTSLSEVLRRMRDDERW